LNSWRCFGAGESKSMNIEDIFSFPCLSSDGLVSALVLRSEELSMVADHRWNLRMETLVPVWSKLRREHNLWLHEQEVKVEKRLRLRYVRWMYLT
jgi:hypothetical protein